MGKKDKDGGAKSYNLKVPKGTKDWDGEAMVIREKIFSTITQVFKRHGAVTIDTPVFELKEILSGKYGEDSKLIYDLADQGGELCSLRYDLTVPFARWLAMNSSIQNIKRYHIAKVYRRDQPAMTKGRMREFYQCDFDIAGQYDAMIPDAEILRITSEIFDELGWKGKYTIKINHRKILDGIFTVCGVPKDKIRTISSAVDKLDKSPWTEVRREMTEDKGLDPEVADKIGEYVVRKGGRDLLESLQADATLSANETAKQGLADMELLFNYLDIFSVYDRVSFDMSLARGLDYYTGVIYEVVTEASAPPAAQQLASASSSTTTTTPAAPSKPERKSKAPKQANGDDDDRSNDPSIGVGSIAAGGRYDDLVGMFSGRTVPCVGISFGVERIFSITRARLEAEGQAKPRLTDTDVYIMAMGGNGYLTERMEIAKRLWSVGVKAEFFWKVKPRFDKQFAAAEKGGVPWSILLGEEELKEGKCRIKELGLEEGHPEKNGVLITLADLESEVLSRISGAKQADGVVDITKAMGNADMKAAPGS
ncbi:histidine-tRNA ligase [Sphaceloma murrayae]|uniref:histidine--tRNA ligase n=1 Tax=Sphaceloma murrayae TaxID=2082308 RepID=A0A2K1R131_9PEZI|nr:histidine-tRNA ligase [Sphaceloma murrayae]